MKQYIAATNEFNELFNHVCAPIFKKVFDYTANSARLEISVVGLYRLWVNGKEITKGWLAPYFSNPNQVVYYDEYDVSNLLREKDNTIVVLLGNGFVNSNSHGSWKFDQASYRSAPKFYLGLYDGAKQVLTTDETWTVYDSPILFDDYRNGEYYDARKESELFQKGRQPLLVDTPTGIYKQCCSQPIKTFEELKAVKIFPSKNGYVYDFGKNESGVCRLSINGNAGQKIILLHGEILQDGVLDIYNLINLPANDTKLNFVQRDYYICKEGEQSYTPSFVYHGFRYVYVEGITKSQATKDLLTFITFHNDLRVRGHFSCSDEMINKIQECAVRSDLTNFHHFPTDCPQREKNGWTGDAVLSAEQMYYNLDATESFREWLVNIRSSQNGGAFPGIVPTDTWGYAWGSGMGWDTIIAELPYQMHRFTGNKEYIEENIDAIEKYLEFIKTKITDEGLMDYGLGEWVEVGRETSEGLTPREVGNSLNFMDFMAKIAALFKAVSKYERAEYVLKLRANMIAAFRKKYVQDGWVICKTQTAQTLALAYGVFSADEDALAYQNLLCLIRGYNNRFKVGCFGMKYLFDVLSNHGDTALAIELMTEPTYPSYGYWIEKFGATTLFEAFQEYEESNEHMRRKDGGDFIVSLNHHFLGSVSAWFYRALAGLDVISADKIRIAPKFDSGLSWASADFENNEKKISLLWEKTAKGYTITVENDGFDLIIDIDGIQRTTKMRNKTIYFVEQ